MGECFFQFFFFNCLLIASSSQDLVVDWSVLRPKARYPLLRTDLLYANHISVSNCGPLDAYVTKDFQVYYFAIVSLNPRVTITNIPNPRRFPTFF